MKIGVVAVASPLQVGEEDQEISQRIGDTLEKLGRLGVETISSPLTATNVKSASEQIERIFIYRIDALAILIITGGTERIIVESLKEVSLPVFLLANSRNNTFMTDTACSFFLPSGGGSPK